VLIIYDSDNARPRNRTERLVVVVEALAQRKLFREGNAKGYDLRELSQAPSLISNPATTGSREYSVAADTLQ
jgi:hypothetical protein